LAGVYGEDRRRGRGSCHGSGQDVVPRGVKRHDAEPRAWRGRGDDGDVHPDAVDPVRYIKTSFRLTPMRVETRRTIHVIHAKIFRISAIKAIVALV
jgi:hypothetical protein